MKGFTDRDMTEIRSETPIPSRLSCFAKFSLEKRDVKTAFLSGDREEARRDVNAEVFLLRCVLPPSWRGDLGASPSGHPQIVVRHCRGVKWHDGVGSTHP